MDQVHGVNLIQKILSSSYVDLRERQRIADRVKQMLAKNKLLHIQGYKRLLEEINMVLVDSNPGPSLATTLPGLMMPSASTATWMNQEWATLHAHYLSAATAVMQQQQQQMFNNNNTTIHINGSPVPKSHSPDKDINTSASDNTLEMQHGLPPPATTTTTNLPPIENNHPASALSNTGSFETTDTC
jgi:hypothetical protein